MNNTDRLFVTLFVVLLAFEMLAVFQGLANKLDTINTKCDTIIKGQQEQLKATDDLAKSTKIIADKAFNGPSKAVLPLAFEENK